MAADISTFYSGMKEPKQTQTLKISSVFILEVLVDATKVTKTTS